MDNKRSKTNLALMAELLVCTLYCTSCKKNLDQVNLGEVPQKFETATQTKQYR